MSEEEFRVRLNCMSKWFTDASPRERTMIAALLRIEALEKALEQEEADHADAEAAYAIAVERIEKLEKALRYYATDDDPHFDRARAALAPKQDK